MNDSGGSGERAGVLVVDDHPVARLGLIELLRGRAGLRACAEADDARTAYHALRAHHPQLVVLDIALRSGGGIELVRRLRDADGDVPLLVITSHHEPVYAERALRAGASGFISKRAPVDELLVAVQRVMEGDVYVSEALSGRLLNRIVHGDRQRAGVESLSNRELEVFELIGRGKTTREIADRLHLSVKTIETYRENTKVKLDLRSSVELIREATQWLLVD